MVAHTRTRVRSAESSAILMVIIIDLSSVCLMIPYCLNMEFSVHEGGEICREEWTGLSRIGFGVTTIVLQFCVPFLVSLYVYLYIIHSLKDRTKEKLRASVHLRKRKTIKAVSRFVSIIILFLSFLNLLSWNYEMHIRGKVKYLNIFLKFNFGTRLFYPNEVFTVC